MSVQFGIWSLDGTPVDAIYLDRVKAAIAPYGPDHKGAYMKHNVSIVYRAFHTTKESRREMQPCITASGAVITWDGRLDNRSELIGSFSDLLTTNSTDLSIVAAAYDKWGVDCFAKLIGDWAASIWDPNTRSLVLAKDPIGTRHLYYSFERNQITWSTILDALVLFTGKTFQIKEEYIAGWLSFFPATHLTPYTGIHSVPPSCFVLLRPESWSIKKYWDFDPSKRIVYRTDGEYEEHFRAAFREAIQRRLRSDCPILAELSGGRDSSSIVCMADVLIARGMAETPRLDTVSYYSDSEANWNERPYFTKIEEKRCRIGSHIDASKHEPFNFEIENEHFAVTPGSGGHPSEASTQYSRCLNSNGNRVVLSGIGGDEVMGGVPTPTPELENLLSRARFRTLAHQLKLWALERRQPWFHLLWEAAREFLSPALVGVPKHMRPAPWLKSSFAKRHWAALSGYPFRTKLFGPLPSFQVNVATLDALRRQLACTALPFNPPFEKRYPYLDRDLLEFMFAIPREQLVRPTQRRSLMRRALVGIVPDEILNRKTKAFISRASMVAISENWPEFAEMTQNLLSTSLGIVDSERISETLQKVRRGERVPMVTLKRTLLLEGWLKNLRAFGIIDLGTTSKHELRWQVSARA